MSLQAYLDDHGIRHFSAVEINPVGKRANGNGVELLPAPKPLWPNIIHTLQVLEWLRERVGPLHILSAYRDPQYNAAIGGEDKSLHMLFNACDICSKAKTPRQLHVMLSVHPKAKEMGLGLYKGFVHVDTRGMIGLPAPARWNG